MVKRLLLAKYTQSLFRLSFPSQIWLFLSGLSTLPHFAGDSRILSISPSLPHEIPNLPHKEEEDLQIKKKHISLAFLDPEILALKVEVQFIQNSHASTQNHPQNRLQGNWNAKMFDLKNIFCGISNGNL